MWEVHAVPNWFHARRRSDGQDHSEPEPGSEPVSSPGSVRCHVERLALRAGWADPLSRAQRAPALSEGFWRRRCGSIESALRIDSCNPLQTSTLELQGELLKSRSHS